MPFIHSNKILMPEGVEVEICCRRMREHCLGKRITKASTVECGGHARDGLRDDIVIEGVSPTALETALTGAKLSAISRKGKYSWWSFDRPQHLVCHFGMDGGWFLQGRWSPLYVRAKEEELDVWPPRFTKLLLTFDDGTQAAFVNARRFGRLWLQKEPLSTPPVSLLGLDPLVDFPLPAFAALLSSRSCPIKAAILDQAVTAGVGNWIADESLYQSRLHPSIPCNLLTPQEIATLHTNILNVFTFAVEHEDYNTYPSHWLFNYRWGKGKGPQHTAAGDLITFVTVGGRTSAVVTAVQGTGAIGTRKASAKKESAATSDETAAAASGAKRKQTRPVKSEPSVKEEVSTGVVVGQGKAGKSTAAPTAKGKPVTVKEEKVTLKRERGVAVKTEPVATEASVQTRRTRQRAGSSV